MVFLEAIEGMGMAAASSFNFGLKGAAVWGKAIYTLPVLKVAGIANGVTAAVALPVAAGAGLTYLYAKKKVEHFEGLKTLLKDVNIQLENSKELSEEEKEKIDKKINSINNKLFI